MGLDAIASRQYGAFNYAQAREAGFSPTQIQRRRRTGVWTVAARNTFVLPGSPNTILRRISVAVLAGGDGAAASHLTSAWLRDLYEAAPDVIDITIPYQRRGPRDVARYRRSRTLETRDIGLVRSIPATKVPRTLLDCTATLPLDLAEGIVDEALLQRRATCDSVRRYLRDRELWDVPGGRKLRDLLSDRDAGALNKKLEREFVRLMRASTLPMPIRQYPWRRYKIDFAYPDLKIAIELDGVAKHGSAEALNSDLERQNALALDGWLILRFTWRRVTRESAGVLDEIARAIANRAGGGT